ncbi:copper amine oxidase [Sporomusa sphaeroides DSM 2875]|uniref:copper amine oxidase n=1 Tax=Sporomusa sphaeroides TaxID=47679 RepID=UPI00202F277B|nr:copper amine oxidase [Sporomusa sphaeroides]MCM0757695.1 copper amine oxidase [Sporomusa sphaeroides DSM 2875]
MLKWLRQASVAVAVTIAVCVISSPQLVLAKSGVLSAADLERPSELPATVTEQSGKLLLSDSPEMVPDDGIMYQDTVSGDIRLFFHHVNATMEPKKIVVLLVNDTTEAADVIVSRHGLGGPDVDYLAVGKIAQMEYLNQEEVELIHVPANGTAHLVSVLRDTVVLPNELVNGIYDFRTKIPLKVVVMMLPVEAEAAEFAATAAVLPADSQRLRGTFHGSDRLIVPSKVYNAKKDGIIAITLADHKRDMYVSGIDATDGSETLNYGNYGVVYKVFLPTAFEQKYAVYLNPRGGEYAGGIKVKYRHQHENTIGTPADKLFFGTKTVTDAAHLGNYEGGQSLWLTFSPPGASNLPVKIVLAPAGKTE